MALSNERLKSYPFLAELYEDDYFPTDLVDKGRSILLRLCESIESERPQTLAALYQLTHAATEQFNQLNNEFEERGSEIETVARDAIGVDISTIAEAYGFSADDEELIAPRDW